MSAFQQAAKRAALHAWRKDGEPERDSTEGSVGRDSYETWARTILDSLAELGYRVVRSTKQEARGNGE